MTNYLKSEFYRITHTPYLYIFVVIAMGLSVFLATTFSGALTGREAGIDYSFTYVMSLVARDALSTVFFAALITTFIYSGANARSNTKNALSMGIKRSDLFLAQSIVATVAAYACLLLIFLTFILSCLFLTTEPTMVALIAPAKTTFIAFPTAFTAIVFALACLQRFDRTIIAVVVWILIFNIAPSIIHDAGIHNHVLAAIDQFIPFNVFASSSQLDSYGAMPIWHDPTIMLQVIIAGVVFAGIFFLLGLHTLKQKEF